MNLNVGDRVTAKGRSRTTYRGTVRYIGCLPDLEHKGEFIGLELKAPHGTSDGRGLFKTKPKHALFCKRNQIKDVIASAAAAAASKYTGSAATSHSANDTYMDDFDQGLEQLRLAHGGSKTSSSSFQRGAASTGREEDGNPSWKDAAIQDQIGRGNDDPFTLKPRQNINNAIQRHSSTSNSINCGTSFSTSTVNKEHSTPSSQWNTGPVDPQGLLFDASDRNILCQSLLGNKCVVGSADHGLKEFDTRTGKQIRELYNKKSGHSEWVTCVSHLSDGRIVSGGMDNKLCLWGERGGRCTDLIGHSGSISSVCTSASGSHVISTSYDKTVRVWHTQRGSEVTTLRGHTAPVLDLDWSTEGQGLLLTGDRSGVACIWDLESGSNACQLKNHRGHVTALKWLQGGQTCVTGDQAGSMRLWDSRSDSSTGCVQAYQTHPGGAINDFQLSGAYLVSTGADTKIQVMDFRGGSGSGSGGGGGGGDCVHTWTSHRDFIYSLDTMQEYVVTGSGDGLMLFHSIRTGKLLYGMGASQGAVRCIDATSNCVVASGDDGNVLVYAF